MFVMIGKTSVIRDRIAERIRRTRRTDVFVRDDFADFGAYDVVGRELRKLVREGLLVQVGYGLYARAKRSVLSGKPIPSVPLIEIGYQALRRLGHSPKPSQAVWITSRDARCRCQPEIVLRCRGRAYSEGSRSGRAS
jgi:hypothetical protein